MNEEKLNIDAIVNWIDNSQDGEVKPGIKDSPAIPINDYRFIIGDFDFRVSRFTGFYGNTSDTLHARKSSDKESVITITDEGASKIYLSARDRVKDWKIERKRNAIQEINKTLSEKSK